MDTSAPGGSGTGTALPNPRENDSTYYQPGPSFHSHPYQHQGQQQTLSFTLPYDADAQRLQHNSNGDQQGAHSETQALRKCSVRGCSNDVMPDARTKMCEVCRGKHRVYATTKRAKRKLEKEAVIKAISGGTGMEAGVPISADSASPGADVSLFRPKSGIEGLIDMSILRFNSRTRSQRQVQRILSVTLPPKVQSRRAGIRRPLTHSCLRSHHRCRLQRVRRRHLS